MQNYLHKDFFHLHFLGSPPGKSPGGTALGARNTPNRGRRRQSAGVKKPRGPPHGLTAREEVP